ncbi:MAG: response regulator [Nitrospirota bacterium]
MENVTAHYGPDPVRILVVDDDPADRKLIKTAFRMKIPSCEVNSVKCGEEGLEYIGMKTRRTSDVSWPDLILLDLNMPGIDGFEFLKRMKNDERFSEIPIIVMTSSCEEKDVRQSYRLRSNAYITKPSGLEGYYEIVEKIEDFWFSACKLPNKCI